MTTDAFKQYLAELSAEYRDGLPGKLAEVDGLWQTFIAEGTSAELLHALQRKLHTLAGSAKTFGFAGVSVAARAAEEFLDPFTTGGTLPDSVARDVLVQLLDALRQSASIQ